MKKPSKPLQIMKENQMQQKTANNERQPAVPTFVNTTIVTKEAKGQQAGAKENKPVYQTYIYRSHGGGYQGL